MPDLSKWIKAVNELTKEVGTAIQQTAIENSPFVTGRYRQGIEYDNAYTVTANTEYSAAIEYGIQNPVEITPKTAKALHFNWNGKDVFYKKVKQKPRNPNPVMRNSARAVQKQIPELFKIAQQKSGL